MFKIFKILVSILLLQGCITMPKLLPASSRTKSYDIVTKLDKKKSFQQTSIWAAKTFVNSNEAVKLRDAEMGLLIAKANLSCSALRLGGGLAKNQRVEFIIEIQSDDNKTTIKISDIVCSAEGIWDNYLRPSSDEDINAISKECLQPLVDEVKSTFNNLVLVN